jgi:hypothetical protein
MASEKMIGIEALYAQSDLPETPDESQINELLIKIREALYGSTEFPSF